MENLNKEKQTNEIKHKILKPTEKIFVIAIMMYSYILTYKYGEKFNYNLLESILYDVAKNLN